MPPIVVIDRLGKSFGRTTAVRDLSFSIEEGDVVGFIGPNGAGKTTTLKMLATILRPTTGDAFIAGHSVRDHAAKVRPLIGYMPDVCGLYEDMLVHEYLRFFASVYGIKGEAADRAVDGALAITGLEVKATDLCGALSRGMSQRLHLARVLLHDPKLLLLDEPASGLDPRARIEFKELVLTLKGMGKTLLISSHILSELAEMCDSIVIIEQSRLVYSGPVSDASKEVHAQGRVYVVAARLDGEGTPSAGDLVETIRSFGFVDAVREGKRAGQVLVRFQPGFDECFTLNQALVGRGFRIEHFAPEEVRLEDAFLHLTRGAVQ